MRKKEREREKERIKFDLKKSKDLSFSFISTVRLPCKRKMSSFVGAHDKYGPCHVSTL